MKFTYQGNEYDLILFSLAGSRFYGTHFDALDPERQHPFNPNYSSDHDWRGIFVAHPDTKLGVSTQINEIMIKKPDDVSLGVSPEHHQLIKDLNEKLGLNMSDGEDLVLYEIKKFFTLAVEANPNILDIVFADDESVIYENAKGKKLRAEGKGIFMSMKTKFTFSGYAMSQLNRIRGTIQYCDETLKILFTALEHGDIDDQWIRANFKGLHAQKLKHEYRKLTEHTL